MLWIKDRYLAAVCVNVRVTEVPVEEILHVMAKKRAQQMLDEDQTKPTKKQRKKKKDRKRKRNTKTKRKSVSQKNVQMKNAFLVSVTVFFSVLVRGS